MYNGIIRQIFVVIWRQIKRLHLKKKGIILDRKVLFNPMTTFGVNCRIHNNTDITDSCIGSYTYISNNCIISNCIVGKFCSIASGVKVISSTHPSRNFVSTSPVFYSIKKQCGISFVENTVFKEILSIENKSAIIGNDVWIGEDVKIIGGVTIGDGAILATGSVVNKDVPPYAIVGGIPAKIIRYRFDEDTIELLLKDSWWNKPTEWLKTNAKSFKYVDNYLELIQK